MLVTVSRQPNPNPTLIPYFCQISATSILAMLGPMINSNQSEVWTC